MELVDSLAQVSDLEGACRVLMRSPALGRPFHACSILMANDRAELSEIARSNVPGQPADFQGIRLWKETALSAHMVEGQPALVSREDFEALHPDIRFDWETSSFESVWLFPVPERGVPFGLVLLFSDERVEPVDLTESQRELLVTALKMPLRSQQWRQSLAVGGHSDDRARAS